MSWPRGRPRPKKVGTGLTEVLEAVNASIIADQNDRIPEPNHPPADWRKGALLNVRNRGDAYVITLYPEEYSDEKPERGLRFTNPGEAQDFISMWYQRENHDPRAR